MLKAYTNCLFKVIEEKKKTKKICDSALSRIRKSLQHKSFDNLNKEAMWNLIIHKIPRHCHFKHISGSYNLYPTKLIPIYGECPLKMLSSLLQNTQTQCLQLSFSMVLLCVLRTLINIFFHTNRARESCIYRSASMCGQIY